MTLKINESIDSTNNEDYNDLEIFHVGDVVNVAAYSVMAVGRLIKINQIGILQLSFSATILKLITSCFMSIVFSERDLYQFVNLLTNFSFKI